jgi:hypothetical protein
MRHLFITIGLLMIMVLAAAPVLAQTVDVPTEQIQMGTFSSSGTSLSDGSGDRQFTVAISFPKPFKVKPDVMVALTMIDVAGSVGTRVSVTADGISRDGFTAVIKTWADSKVYAIKGSWVAVAPTTVTVKVKK